MNFYVLFQKIRFKLEIVLYTLNKHINDGLLKI